MSRLRTEVEDRDAELRALEEELGLDSDEDELGESAAAARTRRNVTDAVRRLSWGQLALWGLGAFVAVLVVQAIARWLMGIALLIGIGSGIFWLVGKLRERQP